VLVSLKRTRLEAESIRLNLIGEALERDLKQRGFNVKNLLRSHDAHHRSFEQVRKALDSRGINFSVEFAKSLNPEQLKDVDFVISVGGDGTLLETAQLVKTSHTPMLGINSDPESSTGKLCAYALRHKHDFDHCMHRIERGNFSWFYRSRVGLVMITKDGSHIQSERSALNEILVAEKDVCRPTMHQTKIDDDAFGPVQRSCGVLVCSGSGSTAWMHSAASVRVDDAELILEAAGAYDFKHLANRVSNVVNREFILPPSSSNVMYFIRELLYPSIPSVSSVSRREGSEPPRRGFANSVSVRSLGFDTYVFLDGLANIPVENGTTCVMQIHPERSLRTFVF